MKRILAGALCAGILLISTTPAIASGAIALNKHNPEHFGYAMDRPGHRAEEDALNNCTGNCEIIYRFDHTCAALASEGGHDGGYGYGHADNEGEAKHIAMHECEQHANHCEIRMSGCDH